MTKLSRRTVLVKLGLNYGLISFAIPALICRCLMRLVCSDLLDAILHMQVPFALHEESGIPPEPLPA